MARNEKAPAVHGGQGDGGEEDRSSTHSPIEAPAFATCAHVHRRPSADGNLLLCYSCGRIVGPRTQEGESEICVLAARSGLEEGASA